MADKVYVNAFALDFYYVVANETIRRKKPVMTVYFDYVHFKNRHQKSE